jgi:hypothetical protein
MTQAKLKDILENKILDFLDFLINFGNFGTFLERGSYEEGYD